MTALGQKFVEAGLRQFIASFGEVLELLENLLITAFGRCFDEPRPR